MTLALTTTTVQRTLNNPVNNAVAQLANINAAMLIDSASVPAAGHTALLMALKSITREY